MSRQRKARKLTAEQVREIRRARDGIDMRHQADDPSLTLKALAARYGVSPKTIFSIGTRETYQEVPDEPRE